MMAKMEANSGYARCNFRKSNKLQGERADGQFIFTRQKMENLLSEFSQNVFRLLVENPETKFGDFCVSKCFVSKDNFDQMNESDEYVFGSIDCKNTVFDSLFYCNPPMAPVFKIGFCGAISPASAYWGIFCRKLSWP